MDSAQLIIIWTGRGICGHHHVVCTELLIDGSAPTEEEEVRVCWSQEAEERSNLFQ